MSEYRQRQRDVAACSLPSSQSLRCDCDTTVDEHQLAHSVDAAAADDNDDVVVDASLY